MQPTPAVQRIRTVVGVVVAVLAIAWFARVPVAESDLGLPASEGSPSEVASAAPSEGLPGGPLGPSEVEALVEDVGRQAVVRVDPVTLADLGPAVTTVGAGWRATAAGTSLVLAEAREDAGGAVLRVAGPELATAWRVERADAMEDLAWFGERDGIVAWITTSGIIRVQSLGSPGAYRTLTLPLGRSALDARLVGDGLLAIVSEPTPAEGAVLAVLDTVGHVVVVEVPLGAAGESVGLAWDLPDGSGPAAGGPGRLLVAGSRRDADLQAVDLGTGSRTEVALDSAPATGQILSRDLAVAVDGGRVLVSGTEQVRLPGGRGDGFTRPFGIAVVEPVDGDVGGDLAVTAFLADGQTVAAVPLPGGEGVLAIDDGGSALLLGRTAGSGAGSAAALERIGSPLPGVVVRRVVPTPSVTYAFAAAGCSLATTDPADCEITELVALDNATGEVTGRRPVSPGAVLLPSPTAGLLLVGA